MQTRSSSKFVSESSTNLMSTNSKHRNRRRSKPRVEPFSIVEIPIVTMANNRTMEEMLQAPTERYGDAIVVPDILVENFVFRTWLLSLIQANQFYGFESNNPHDHVRSFNRITSTLKFSDVLNDAIKLMLFPYSLEGAAKIWGDLKAITTQSGVSYDGPPIPPPFSSLPKVVERVPEVTKDTVQQRTKNIQPSVAQTQVPIDKPIVAPKPKPTIPYPSRANKQKLRKKDDNLALKFVEIFRNLHFNLSFADALLHMPKFDLMFISLLNTKEKLFDLATTSVNKNCSAVILKKLPKKLGDPDKLLIPCDFLKLDECLALANLAGIAEDVFVKVGKFHLPTNFVVVDYVVDPRVPLILRRPFLRTERALIDVYGEELTLRVDDEVITFKGGQTLKYSYSDDESVNQIYVIDVAYEEYVQEILGFSKIPKSGSPTPTSDPIISFSSPSFTPFEGKLELKELLSHLEYAFLEGIDKLPVIISKELKDEEKSTLLKVLKSHKRAIAWKIFDIKGIDPRFYTHKILMEDDFKPAVQHQRRVNPKIHEVIKKKVIKLLDAGLIYPIFDSPWVSPVHCVPKKGGMNVVESKDNELMPTRFRLTHKTKKKLPSLVLMECLCESLGMDLLQPVKDDS
nr:hypothetical protein [Tanacetum cinerariifolium]